MDFHSGSDFEAQSALISTLSVSWTWVLDEICAAARLCGRPARIHVKVDTGMSRAGSTLADLPELAQAVRTAEDAGLVQVIGAWSHLSRADDPSVAGEESTRRTVRFLKRVCAFSPKQECTRRFATLLQPRELCGTRRPTTTWFARGSGCMDFPLILQSQVLRNWD